MCVVGKGWSVMPRMICNRTLFMRGIERRVCGKVV